jgi:hypothetical protein
MDVRKFYVRIIFWISTALTISAGCAFAQGSVTGEPTGRTTGNPEFPVEVLGSDGNLYSCIENIVLRNGTQVRRCIVDDGVLFASGGLGGGAAPFILLALIGAVAAASGGESTNGTN